ncbi:hypothetical protein CKAH01_08775 [Colletotrichum kahawae]|uniref:Uncharacterized protein n=1 Tax=Colletotrichum kahawae TaxID=34407 RepID=A0AAD9Y229_COLKA|nr:hypothetical protein CKAH01_08775 [Colletotrichum kahawae]
MKPSFLLPVAALAGAALSAAVPLAEQSQDLVAVLVPEFSDAPFTPEDRVYEANDDEEENDEMSYSHSATYLDGEDAAHLASVDLNTEGAAAWAAVHADLRAALIANTDFTAEDADPYPATLKWTGAHVENKTSELSKLAQDEKFRESLKSWLKKILLVFPKIAEGLEKYRASKQPADGRPKIPDFHVGLSADGVCKYLKGAAWKVQELRRPVEQFSPEYVPWLVENKGPYIYVLDGLRMIEWAFWQLGRSLEYASSFTEEEQLKIAFCHTFFAGSRIQLTTVPPLGPRPVVAPRPLPTTTARPAPVPQTNLPVLFPTPTILPRDNEAEAVDRPLPNKWVLFGFGPLLRLLEEKAPLSKYQTYANVRITRVLRNLGKSMDITAESIIRKIRSPRANEFLIRSGFSDMHDQLWRTVEAFEHNP